MSDALLILLLSAGSYALGQALAALAASAILKHQERRARRDFPRARVRR